MADLHRETEHPRPTPRAVHHEESDVNIRAIFGFGVGLVVVAAVVHRR